MTIKTLITGWNGFFGSILCTELSNNGTNILRCGRVDGSDIKVDLALAVPNITGNIHRVIHSAGVTPRPSRHINTPDVFTIGNVRGTSNLLTGLSSNKPESFVLISSASVYGQISGNQIDETAPLLAMSEYAKSKLASELLVSEWCDEHKVALTIVRLPLLVGIGAPGTLGQLIHAIRKRRFVIPGDGSARKSMVLATDVANWLALNTNIKGTFNLTDQQDPTYAEICDAITNHLEVSNVPRVPLSMMRAAGWFGDASDAILNKSLPYNSVVHRQLTTSLTFSSHAANSHAWQPNSVLKNIDRWLI